VAATTRPLLGGVIAIALVATASCGGNHPHSVTPRAGVTHSQTATATRRSASARTTQVVRPSPVVSPPPDADTFSLVVRTRSGDLPARVAPISVASHQVVDPPHNTAQEWDTAAWVVQAAYPAAPSTGTTYVYGHACHHHVCPFTDLKNAAVGDPVVVSTPSGALNYRIGRIGLSSRSADSLPSWAANSTIPNRIVLVTCEYEQGDTSVNNIVVVANLESAS
jgi:hypothetical protein